MKVQSLVDKNGNLYFISESDVKGKGIPWRSSVIENLKIKKVKAAKDMDAFDQAVLTIDGKEYEVHGVWGPFAPALIGAKKPKKKAKKPKK